MLHRALRVAEAWKIGRKGVVKIANRKLSSQEVAKIALVAPFTGSGSILGEYIKNALVLAVDEINAAGGVKGRQIEYVIYDDAAAPATSLNVVQKAILNDKVSVMFGPNMSSCVLAVHQIAKDNKVPMLVGATSRRR